MHCFAEKNEASSGLVVWARRQRIPGCEDCEVPSMLEIVSYKSPYHTTNGRGSSSHSLTHLSPDHHAPTILSLHSELPYPRRRSPHPEPDPRHTFQPLDEFITPSPALRPLYPHRPSP